MPIASGCYVEIADERARTLTVYGPFPTADAASRGRFFWYSEDRFDELRRAGSRLLFSYGYYGPGELDAVVAEPEAFGYRAVIVHAADALTRDVYWDRFDASTPGFSEQYFTRYFRAEFGREPKLG